MKRCYLCKVEKPTEEFYKDKTRKDGLTTKCKACSKTYRKKNVDPNRTHKFCAKCETLLPLEAFSKNNVGDGYQTSCKTCRSLIPYQIDSAQYKSLIEQQSGACAICGAIEKLVIDHCHQTEKVRGLLCIRCNWGLGHFRDSPSYLEAAAEYLRLIG